MPKPLFPENGVLGGRRASARQRRAQGTGRRGASRGPRRPAGRRAAGLGLALLVASQAFAEDLSPQQARGKQIYFQGTSPRGTPIVAYLGAGATRLPGSAATCAACHGSDGRGRPEAGVIPSDITWDYLVKPYGHTHPMGRKHPAFTAESLKETIRSGRDPAGNVLDASMPVYEIADEDLEDLLAYLQQLADDLDPGVSETGLRIGTVLPEGGRLAPVGEAIRTVLAAAFQEINAQGGIYGRRLELVAASYEAQQTPLAAAEGLLRDGDVFAILSPVVMGADAAIGALVEAEEIPVIGPLTLLSPDPLLLNDFTFYLFSGLREQLQVLVDFATRALRLERPRWAVLAPPEDRYRDLVEALAEQGATHGWPPEPPIEVLAGAEAAAVAEKLAAAEIDALFFLGSGDLNALLRAGEAIGWRPYVFFPGAFVQPGVLELPDGLQGKIHLAYPTVPGDQTPAGVSRLRQLLDGRDAPLRHRTSQVSAFVSTEILTTGLKSAGRDLSREKLLRALEALYEHDTGLTPAITYDANRRIGALGAYVVAVDLQTHAFTPIDGWMTPR